MNFLSLFKRKIIYNLKKKVNIIIITSDKVYKNLEINRGYNEKDILGGEDPYSASKSAADLATQSYCKTILNNNVFVILIDHLIQKHMEHQ